LATLTEAVAWGPRSRLSKDHHGSNPRPTAQPVRLTLPELLVGAPFVVAVHVNAPVVHSSSDRSGWITKVTVCVPDAGNDRFDAVNDVAVDEHDPHGTPSIRPVPAITAHAAGTAAAKEAVTDTSLGLVNVAVTVTGVPATTSFEDTDTDPVTGLKATVVKVRCDDVADVSV